MITCALVNNGGVGGSPTHNPVQCADQVSLGPNNASSSASLNGQHPTARKRTSPCGLFIGSVDQVKQKECVVCGFQEEQHGRHVGQDDPLVITGKGDESDGYRRTSYDSSSSSAIGARPRYEWRNSYDVRGEYLSKQDLRAKYGNNFGSSGTEKKEKEESGQRRLYYPATGAGVYYYTDQSGREETESDRETSPRWPFPSNWNNSKSEPVKRRANSLSDPSPFLTFRPLTIPALDSNRANQPSPFTNPLRPLVPEEKGESAMFGQAKPERPQQAPARPSAFVGYTATFKEKSPDDKPSEKGRKKNGGVSFHPKTAIIGSDGGVENFAPDSPSPMDEENGDEDNHVLSFGPKSELEKLTEVNTEFNADRRNFLAGTDKEKSSAEPPTAPYSISVKRDKCDCVDSNDQPGSPVKSPAVRDGAESAPPVPERSLDSAYRSVQKREPSETNGKSQREWSERLQRMACDLEAARIQKPKAPAPPTPVSTISASSSTTDVPSGVLRKSYSAFVVPALSPRSNSHASCLMTSSVNGSLGGNELESAMLRSFPRHERCSSVDVSAAVRCNESHSAVGGKGHRQSRNRFASIRKFLRISEPPPCSLSSTHRSERGSSSTNCSLASYSSNASSSISNHIGFHSSLRKFPRLPFGNKNRGNLNTLRDLFHGANECHAYGEIAQDTQVVVTDITELPSTNNTLVRASKLSGAFDLPPLHITVEQGNGVVDRFNSSICSHPASTSTPSDTSQDDESVSNKESLGVNGAAVIGQNGHSAAPHRPRPVCGVISACHLGKVKRAAPVVPTNGTSEKTNGKVSVKAEESMEKPAKESETAVWRLKGTLGAMEVTTLVSSSSSSSLLTPTPVERVPCLDDRYDQLVAGHLTSLSNLIEHFPSTIRQSRRKLASIGVDPSKLAWSDFTVTGPTPLLLTESSALYAAALKLENRTELQSLKVNLMLTPLRYINPLPTSANQQHSFFLPIVAEFQDYIQSKLIRLTREEDEGEESGSEDGPVYRRFHQPSTLCKVSVLPRMIVSSIESYADHTSARHRPQKQPFLHEREVCFIMLQLISALKYLQSKGVEEISADLNGFLLFRTVVSRYWQLVLSSESFADHSSTRPKGSARFTVNLCQGAFVALCQLLHAEVPTEELIRDGHTPVFQSLTSYSSGFQKVAGILHQERPNSLTQAKSVLEFMFWVNSAGQEQNGDGQCFLNEHRAKWWLDRERAKFICYAMKALVDTPVEAGTMENTNGRKSNTSWCKLDIVDEYRAQFLLHASVKSLMDAAGALENAVAGDILL